MTELAQFWKNLPVAINEYMARTGFFSGCKVGPALLTRAECRKRICEMKSGYYIPDDADMDDILSEAHWEREQEMREQIRDVATAASAANIKLSELQSTTYSAEQISKRVFGDMKAAIAAAQQPVAPSPPVPDYQRLSKTKNTGGVYKRSSLLEQSRQSREHAKLLGEQNYIKATPCKKCGGVEYYVSSGSCVACARSRRPATEQLTKPVTECLTERSEEPTAPQKKSRPWKLTRRVFDREYAAMKKEEQQ